MTDDSEVVLRLQRSLRSELKAPMGPIFTDTEALLAAGEGPIVAVGDVVTYHLLEADRRPEVALVDGKTEREAVDAAVWDAIDGFDRRIEVASPAATLSAALLVALREAIERAPAETTVLVVDGEEDLAALPAVLLAPEGGRIVYGQPGEGMVHAAVTPELRERTRDILSRMEGDTDRLWTLLGL